MKKVMISASGIKQDFQVGTSTVSAVKSADFEILENTFNIIFGASGSGKSTLLNILTGLQEPSRGQVLFEGVDIYGLKPDDLAYFRAHRIGIVYQSNYWVKSLNVLENVSLPLYFLGYSRSTAAKLAMLALERVDMAPYIKKNPLYLSGGEQQRIAMARALANSPLYVIADEPTGNLDSENGEKIMQLLENCQTEFRCTVMLVTHNMEYLPLADNLLEIQDGLVKQMPHDDISSTTKKLIGDLQARVQRISEDKKKYVS
jgi:putative ABC transport system ATP-binding protein